MRIWLHRHLLLLLVVTIVVSAAIPVWAQDDDPDNDGVPNTNGADLCPEIHGAGNLDGCPPTPTPAPDADGDGMEDEFDLCPNEPGYWVAGGCPDDDRDGTRNTDDRCPTEGGSREWQGCSSGPDDHDGDGILDGEDPCPYDSSNSGEGCGPNPVNCVIGTGAYAFGDTDCDGLYDFNDRCPDVAGDRANGGCPLEAGSGTANPLPVTEAGQTIPITDPNAPSPASEFVAVPPPDDNLCRVATSTNERVNVRFEPTTDALRVDQLQPGNWYLVYELQSAAEDSWYRVDTGWVAEWVTQSSGDCSTIIQSVAAVQVNDSDIGTEMTVTSTNSLDLTPRNVVEALIQLSLGWFALQVQQWF